MDGSFSSESPLFLFLPDVARCCSGSSIPGWSWLHSSGGLGCGLKGITSAYPSGGPGQCTWLECDDQWLGTGVSDLFTAVPGARCYYRGSGLMKDPLWKWQLKFTISSHVWWLYAIFFPFLTWFRPTGIPRLLTLEGHGWCTWVSNQ